MASLASLLKAAGRQNQVLGGRKFSTAVEAPRSLTSKIRQYVKENTFGVTFASIAIGVSGGLGLFTAYRELLHSPGVMVNKKKRQEIPEVVEPDYVLHRSEEFVNKSIYRKLAQKSPIYQQIRDAMSSSSSVVPQ
eukprot:TRINITY_DN2437_c0_g1_i3.p1 TRINITY_DN2437_c0_g1~~TRINITY_DN2437_c0_g1_i3.p1  ORF type:complete len:135 (+),score=18.20 TRINITY_DN2437_c0_g1_i3:234-638(+)